MSNEDSQDRERDLRDRIASLIRANAQAPRRRITDQEQQKLKAAANRLDQILKSGEEAEREALQKAAARLGQMLKDLRKGKDINLRQRREA